MSIWDDLMGRIKQTGDTIKAEAGKRAAQATIDQLKSRVASAADGVLDGMEEDLEKARAAREGRPATGPSAEDPIADRIIAQEREALSGSTPSAPRPSFAEQKADRRARAAAELAAIKARLGKSDDD